MFFETLKRFFGRPTTQGMGDLPVAVRDFWDLPSVRMALRNLERGQFLNAAMMVDAMGRDDRLVGVFNTRVEGLLGLPLEQNPSDPSDDESRKVADDLEDCWDDIFPSASLAKLIKWGLYLGLGVGELVWDVQDGLMQPRLKVWHPQYVFWRWDTRSYWLVTATDSMVELTFGDGHWVGFAPFGLHTAYLEGLVRALAQPWLMRNDAYRDWARYSEIHGLPLVKAKIPASANPADKKEFVMDITGRGNEAVIALPQRDGAGMAQFDLELMEAVAESHKAFDLLIARTETSMAITVLGQNLSTEVKGGSFAAAKVHDSVRHDLIDADAMTLERCIRDQVLKPWAEYNYGDSTLAPRPKYSTEPATDRGTTSKSFSDLSTSLVQFKNAGAPVDQRAVLEEFGVPTTAEDAPVAPAPGAPPAGGGTPGNDDPEPEPTEDDPTPSPAQSRRLLTGEAVVVH